MTYPMECSAFAPASIGNLACGFDVMGLALAGPGDEVLVRRVDEPGVKLASIEGDGGRLSRETARNAAGAAAEAVLGETGREVGLKLHLKKGLPLSAGMGGSAASAVAAAVAVDGLLGSALPPETLLRCALAGERATAGAAHPDNAAPSLLGGLVLTPVWDPPAIIQLRVPEELTAVHVHPHLEVDTRSAREVLGSQVPLRDAVAQWGNTAALVAGLFREDWTLIARSVVDRVAEPKRAAAVPGFEQVKGAALRTGALAASLSGSGPSVFALCRGMEVGGTVGRAMVDAFAEAGGVDADLIVSPGQAPGARILHVG